MIYSNRENKEKKISIVITSIQYDIKVKHSQNLYFLTSLE